MMPLEEKAWAYSELIRRVKTSYPPHCEYTAGSPIRLEWCDDCEEINLWTYWQGRGHLNARFLLVGQDWGCPWDNSAANVMNNIRALNRGETVGYMDHNYSTTNTRLIRLFHEVGYDILSDNDKNQELFFTNFVLGYRNHGISENFRKEWARNDAGFFRELVNIIEPEKILCLGNSTFESVLMALDNHRQSPPIKGYNAFITSPHNPVVLPLESGYSMQIYALAHCGAMGTLNRNRYKDIIGEDILEAQLHDWCRVFER